MNSIPCYTKSLLMVPANNNLLVYSAQKGADTLIGVVIGMKIMNYVNELFC